MQLIIHLLGRLRRARLLANTSGAALVEFAIVTPFVLMIGGTGIELANYAVAMQRVSQVALNLADNASRVGLPSNLAATQLRELDVNDVLQAARLQGGSMALTTNGRVTLTSLENVQQSYDNNGAVQRIHWQRCIGLMHGSGFDSSYGTTPASSGSDNTLTNAGTATPNGMGDTGYLVNAPAGWGVMFVEVNYNYQPVFGSLFMKPTRIHQIASFVVRDNRDYSQLYNPAPSATVSSCDKYAT